MSAARKELEIDDRSDQAREVLEALTANESLILVGKAPRALIDELEDKEPGRFEWSLLEGGERVRLLVRRRTDAGGRTVTSFLQNDHRRLDDMIPEVERLATASLFDEARAHFKEFVCGLDWHIDVEEQVLFPFFEAKTGMKSGPTMIMRGEHIEIRGRMQQLTEALAAHDPARVHDALGNLTSFLASHNAKEERMLYPMTDRAIGTVDAQEQLVQRLAKY
jgi:hemerythrin-like domain-containing protein/uncharacterized protein (DUF2249 family)